MEIEEEIEIPQVEYPVFYIARVMIDIIIVEFGIHIGSVHESVVVS